MNERKFVTKKLKASLGERCVNCGSNQHVEYHHIVPLSVGGLDEPRNMVPLCHSCHMAIHNAKHMQKYALSQAVKKGRHPNCTDAEAFKAIDMLAEGVIGNKKCKELMKIKPSCQVSGTSQFKKWAEKHNVKKIRSFYDVVAVNNPSELIDGKVIGHVEYCNGNKTQILYRQSDINDCVYEFRDKERYPTPTTIKTVKQIEEAHKRRFYKITL